MNIMYVSHISWDWIKQRPHFLAEELQSYYNVDVYVRMDYKRNNLINNNTYLNRVFKLFQLPFCRFKIIKKINNWLFGIFLKVRIYRYEVIWITSPSQYSLLKDSLHNKIIVYDCMDDHIEFPNLSDKERFIFSNNEKHLIQKADIILVSSNSLKNTLKKRYELSHCELDKIHLINNGISQLEVNSSLSNREKNVYRVVYIGTISKWFNFSLIIKSLEKFNNLEYHLYGPIETEIPSHERIVYHGVIPHSKINQIMNDADGLIMPFILNKLILSVDPVKLYEYIASLRPVISVKYGETMRFSNFVYLYSNEEEYLKLISDLIENKLKLKYSRQDVISFLQDNTWKKRSIQIKEIISRQVMEQ